MTLEKHTTIESFTRRMQELRGQGKRLGVVPTMGALHEGHISLMRACIADCDITAATIFVNPSQFAPDEDLDQYPRTLTRDEELLAAAGVDILFAPTNEEMYPQGFSTWVEPPQVARVLEGKVRPDHFRGVATIVLKLLNIASAHAAFFGQKDYQQAQVIRAMVADLNVPTEIVVCPIVREADGLAMSSRNRYLSQEDRRRALALSQSLEFAKKLYEEGERNGVRIEKQMMDVLQPSVDAVDYAAVFHADTLNRLETIDQPAVAAVACRVGETRLIDNMILK